MMDPAPLTPLTNPSEPRPVPMPPGKLALRLAGVLLIWLVANLLVFIAISFLVFVVLASLGMLPDESFTFAVLCAIPPALIVSSLIAGRRLYYIVSHRYPDSR